MPQIWKKNKVEIFIRLMEGFNHSKYCLRSIKHTLCHQKLALKVFDQVLWEVIFWVWPVGTFKLFAHIEAELKRLSCCTELTPTV